MFQMTVSARQICVIFFEPSLLFVKCLRRKDTVYMHSLFFFTKELRQKDCNMKLVQCSHCNMVLIFVSSCDVYRLDTQSDYVFLVNYFFPSEFGNKILKDCIDSQAQMV